MSQDNKGPEGTPTVWVRRGAVFVPTEATLNRALSICPLEKLDLNNRINSWFTASYSVETTDSSLPRTLLMMMTPTSSAQSIVALALVLQGPLVWPIMRDRETGAATDLQAEFILTHSESQNH